jgi:hypothetical protein
MGPTAPAPRRHALAIALLALAPVVSLVGGCPADDPCAGAEPAYGGLGNDEVWLTLKDAQGRATTGGDAASAVVPSDGQRFDGQGAAPTFSWQSPLKLALGPALPKERAASTSPSVRQSRAARAFAAAAALLIPSAHAHLPPVSSDAYLVEVAVPGAACPIAIVTTELSHALDEGTWGALRAAAGKELTLRITSAYLSDGRITEGPLLSSPVSFAVE